MMSARLLAQARKIHFDTPKVSEIKTKMLNICNRFVKLDMENFEHLLSNTRIN